MGPRAAREEPRRIAIDEPPQDRALRVAVVGAGFCGAMTAVHLARSARPVAVTLLERGPFPARGLAFGTDRPEHLLNVPAGRMSALPRDPDHFRRFAASSGLDASPDAFHPRTFYRAYLEDLLASAVREASPPARLKTRRGEAVDVVPRGTGATVVLASGESVEADRVVLALGNLPPDDPLAGLDLPPDRYVKDPWTEGALDAVPAGGTVLFLGTGLTFVDLALTLRAKGHRGRILAISRRGLLPQPYVGPVRAAPFDPAPILAAAGTIRGLTAAFRREAERRRERGGDWRDVVAALRPLTQRLWASLPVGDRARFLRHVRPYWETHRHRMPPASAAAIGGLVRDGTMSVRAGRVVDAAPIGRGLRLSIAPRGGGPRERTDVARVVAAVGPSTDLERSAMPLVRALLSRGLATGDPLRLGLEADGHGAVLSGDGTASSWLFAVGPLRKAALWECTAVPELCGMAAEVAGRVVAGVP